MRALSNALILFYRKKIEGRSIFRASLIRFISNSAFVIVFPLFFVASVAAHSEYNISYRCNSTDKRYNCLLYTSDAADEL